MPLMVNDTIEANKTFSPNSREMEDEWNMAEAIGFPINRKETQDKEVQEMAIKRKMLTDMWG